MPPAASLPDQRSSDRFGLALPITLEGEECASHDLSATGLLVESGRALAVGDEVSLTLEMPEEGGNARLACRGRVVRIQQLAGGYNIGLRLTLPLYTEPAERVTAPA